MSNYKRSGGKTRLRVGGRMSEQGADRAGLLLSIAALIAATLLGSAALIGAIGWLL
ncbi:hypothetical protein [Vreelandella piezotolerans]|uniref:hypothetical protein n=1 Tax=Vreelandella piezotolerans TaxID=2609667 RepID=UPI003787386A|tara:strand:+ start:649 stop:816 length:168 start_codon:yes stop_codon:yes gene_type:complete